MIIIRKFHICIVFPPPSRIGFIFIIGNDNLLFLSMDTLYYKEHHHHKYDPVEHHHNFFLFKQNEYFKDKNCIRLYVPTEKIPCFNRIAK